MVTTRDTILNESKIVAPAGCSDCFLDDDRLGSIIGKICSWKRWQFDQQQPDDGRLGSEPHRLRSGLGYFFKSIMFLGSLRNVSSVMFLSSPRNISSNVPQCHVDEEHNLYFSAPMSTRTYVPQDMFLSSLRNISYVSRP
jgi:hypothetical protein